MGEFTLFCSKLLHKGNKLMIFLSGGCSNRHFRVSKHIVPYRIFKTFYWTVLILFWHSILKRELRWMEYNYDKDFSSNDENEKTQKEHNIIFFLSNQIVSLNYNKAKMPNNKTLNFSFCMFLEQIFCNIKSLNLNEFVKIMKIIREEHWIFLFNFILFLFHVTKFFPLQPPHHPTCPPSHSNSNTNYPPRTPPPPTHPLSLFSQPCLKVKH